SFDDIVGEGKKQVEVLFAPTTPPRPLVLARAVFLVEMGVGPTAVMAFWLDGPSVSRHSHADNQEDKSRRSKWSRMGSWNQVS
ncbi:MAG TPA: hypothetical protein VNO21_22325, partial [Polyangiaceae bacterium]|nr:hypothetical protein [Polyangiaceae bacterium]